MSGNAWKRIFPKRPKIYFAGERVIDTRRPEVVGVFQHWTAGGLAVVLFRGGNRPGMNRHVRQIRPEFVLSMKFRPVEVSG